MVDRASTFTSPGFLPVYSVATERERDDLIDAAIRAGVLLRRGPQILSAHLAGEQTIPRLCAFGRQLRAIHAGLLGHEPALDRYDGPTPDPEPERGWFCVGCDQFDTDEQLERDYGIEPTDECPRCEEPMDRVAIVYCEPDDEECPDPDEHHYGAGGHLHPCPE